MLALGPRNIKPGLPPDLISLLIRPRLQTGGRHEHTYRVNLIQHERDEPITLLSGG